MRKALSDFSAGVLLLASAWLSTFWGALWPLGVVLGALFLCRALGLPRRWWRKP